MELLDGKMFDPNEVMWTLPENTQQGEGSDGKIVEYKFSKRVITRDGRIIPIASLVLPTVTLPVAPQPVSLEV